MTAKPDAYRRPLDRAHSHATDWLESVPERRVPPRSSADEVRADLDQRVGAALPEEGADPADVIDELAAAVEPGLMAIPSGRFFGWVMGGTVPAAMAADWLVGAWDQNAGMRYATPGVVAVEEQAGRWLLDLLGLPGDSAVGFASGATMANFTGLAAARHQVLAQAGWDVERHGLQGAPPVRVLVGAEEHTSVDVALRYLGLGAAQRVEVDEQGRVRPEALAAALGDGRGPTIVALQAGNLHSGAFDPFRALVPLAHEHGAWVHVDGAFGLWAAASPSLRHLTEGLAEADSWATDAHKTLNTTYDSGVVVVAAPAPLRASMGARASYFVHDDSAADPFDLVPEMSRRARGVPVWAALRSLGRSGVAALVDRLAGHARALAAGLGAVDGAEILNDVVYTQVSVSFGSDERTRAVTARLIADGTAWMSGSRWRDRDVLRASVSNWSTDDGDVAASVEAVRRAAAST